MALRLNCVGDMIVGSRPSHETVDGNIAMLTSPSELPTPLADYVGMLLLIVRKVVPSRTLA